MNFLVNDNTPSGNYNFILTFTYEDENRINYDGSEIIGIYVQEKKEKADYVDLRISESLNNVIAMKDGKVQEITSGNNWGGCVRVLKTVHGVLASPPTRVKWKMQVNLH